MTVTVVKGLIVLNITFLVIVNVCMAVGNGTSGIPVFDLSMFSTNSLHFQF